MKSISSITASAGLALLLASRLWGQQANRNGTVDPRSSTPSATATRSTDNTKETLMRQAADFVPMTNSERLKYYGYSLISPQIFLYSAAQAGFNQGTDTPKEWGQGGEGYGRRYGSAYAQRVISTTVGNGIAFALHEDNRYFKSGKTGISRLTYALASTLLARNNDGRRSISFSILGGNAAGAFISREWQPHSTNSVGDGAVSFGIAMGARAGVNIVREYLPTRMARFLK